MSENSNSTEYLYRHTIAEERRKRKETEHKNAELASENEELAKRAADAERKNMIFSEILFKSAKIAVSAAAGLAVLAVIRKKMKN